MVLSPPDPLYEVKKCTICSSPIAVFSSQAGGARPVPAGGSLLPSQNTEPAPAAWRQSCPGNENTSEARHKPASGFALSQCQRVWGQDWQQGARAAVATGWAAWPSPAEGWREPGVAGSSGSGVRAGAHRGVCVRAPVYIGRSQPAVSDFRPRLSAGLSRPCLDLEALGGGQRFSPHSPPARGSPTSAPSPPPLPTAHAAAPAASR